MRVAVAVGELVVLAVVGDPADHRALDGQRAGDGQRDLHRPVGLERLVREEPVEADRDAVTGEPVHDHRHNDVGPAEPAAPRQRDRGDQGQERHDDEDAEDDLVGARETVTTEGGADRGQFVVVAGGSGVSGRAWCELGRGCCHARRVSSRIGVDVPTQP